MQLKDIKGIGPKTELLFNRLGIFSADELIRYYPISYEEYTSPVPVSEIKAGAKQTAAGWLIKSPVLRQFGSRQILISEISDGTGALRLMWFNAPYLSGLLKRGSQFYFRGNVRQKNGMLTMEHPEVFTPAQYENLENTLVPVYSLTKGLSGKTVGRCVKAALEKLLPEIREFLPDNILQLQEIMNETDAVKLIHFPKNRQEYEAARKRLVFDELFFFVLGVRMMKKENEEMINEFPMQKVWLTEEVIDRLPFRLTEAQLRVWREIESDLGSTKLMSRLIQGDVGSGKTVLAFLAMIMTAENGYQSTLTAPTEVLAKQHYMKLLNLKEKFEIDIVKPVLLTGSLRAADRREALWKIETGEANAIIGTHALLQETVHYRKLALAITDEQHRFGVRQRQFLTKIGAVPNTMVMSATPIPRTLGMIYYGDLDVSVIDQLPAKRRPIKTAVVDMEWFENAMIFIEKQLAEGRQAYVICPMIEESEDFDAPNVIDVAGRIRKRLPAYKTEILHGRMEAQEKEKIMEAFSSGEAHILVSTTVIEVGVDIPNATVLLVMGAERFGLAQLHQLRGRVGRGQYQSYCIFMAARASKDTLERLKILQSSSDGFAIAEKDLLLRGPGDLLGIRQSGDVLFQIADITKDGSILKLAGETAASVLADDPALQSREHEKLKRVFENHFSSKDINLTL